MQSIIKNEFEEHYITSISSLKSNAKTIEIAAKICIECLRGGNKLLIFGNGGSAAISSHFSVDMTKIGQIRTVNFNESDLLTCFSNDYGYENWVKKCIEFYSDKGDMIILISSSGESKNMINAAKTSKKKKIKNNNIHGL